MDGVLHLPRFSLHATPQPQLLRLSLVQPQSLPVFSLRPAVAGTMLQLLPFASVMSPHKP